MTPSTDQNSAFVTQDGTVPTEAWEPMRTLTATRIGNAAT